MKVRIVALLLAVTLTAGSAQAEGYLAQKVERLPVLELGLGNAGYGVSQKDYTLQTGKGYVLKLKSTGAKECAWIAPDFTNFIWLRKVEVNKVEIKASHIYEIEMEREGEAEIFFVPIRPGEYAWSCRGLEEKGMAGRFIVK
ncbi:copper-binding protein [Aquabacter sp. CN5-332]|uniref:copper-binding protein n=1 Tax=Aquabacter sp. CN5-332 TaxID=3156608 RepID=UPI0032B42F8A